MVIKCNISNHAALELTKSGYRMQVRNLQKLFLSPHRAVGTYSHALDPKLVNKAQSGQDNFQKDFEKSHIKTNTFQKILLGVGSGVVSIANPSRGDMIAVMGEVTGYGALDYVRSRMRMSNEGRAILEDKPRISSKSIDLEKLKSYPEGTLGKAYSNFLEKYKYTPDTRNSVQFVDDLELAYVAQRYRETHDLIHTLLDMPTNMLGEVTVKWVEAIQFKLPMCATGALFGAMRLAPKFTRTYSTRSIIKLDTSLETKLESRVMKYKEQPGIMHLPRVCLPPQILNALKAVIANTDQKNLFEEAKAFGKELQHRILPLEVEDKRRLFSKYYEFYSSKYPEELLENDLIKDKLRSKAIKRLNEYIGKWKPVRFDKRTSLKYLLARAPADYAVLKRVLNEIWKRDENFAPQSLLDFGSGIGTVNWVAHELWGNTLKEYYSVDSSKDMNELASLLLRMNDVENEPFIKNVYYRQFFPATPRLFDIVVSSYSFFEFSSFEQRLRMLTALWNDTKKYLVLIENGSSWGFRIITEARDYLLSISKSNNVDCDVFAPCPHNLSCPLAEKGKLKSSCNFFIHYKKISLGKSDESIRENFCFLILKKEPPVPESERTCRLVARIKKHKKLACCKLCTTEGNLINLFVTKSKHGKHAYKCVKCLNWGDLIPGRLETKMIEYPSWSKISDADAESQNLEELISDSDSDVSDNESDISSNSNLKEDDDDENKNSKNSDNDYVKKK